MSVELKVDWCSYEAAKYAVEKWHYSESMPSGKTVKVGIWENGKFIGVVIFSLGANKLIGSPYGLKQVEICELTRVALSTHLTPVSKILSSAISALKGQSPGVRLIVSYADQNRDHHGGIYQATNWVYVGEIESDLGQMVNGELLHRRTVYSRYGRQDMEFLRQIDPNAHCVQGKPKHKYLYPLDRAMRKQIAPLAKPYPKRDSCVQSVEGDTVGNQSTKEGSIPSGRLHTGIEPILAEA